MSWFYFPYKPVQAAGITIRAEPGHVEAEPVIPLGAQGEWDCRRIQLFGTVLRDPGDGHFAMWYLALGEEPEQDLDKRRAGKFYNNCQQGYATSADGRHWEKPILGQVEYKGSRNNNILSLPPVCPGAPYVIEDPEQGAQPHRYKMIISHGGGGSLAFSTDGRHWESYRDNAALFTGGKERGEREGFDFYVHEPYAFFKDTITADESKRYRVYTQASNGFQGGWIRRTGLVCSPDARRWTIHPRPVMGLPDGAAGFSSQVHGLTMLLHKGYYLAFIHFGLPHPKTGWFAPRVHLALSRDGEHFDIFEDEDQALIPLGPEGSWYAGGLVSGCALHVQDEFWCYFSGLPATACWAGQPGADAKPVINTGLARWDRERIVSARVKPGFAKGYFMLNPFQVDEAGPVEAIINAAGVVSGDEIRVALLNAATQLAVPGFSFRDFSLRKTEGAALKGVWAGNGHLSAGLKIMPCIEMSGTATRLFSAEFSGVT